MGNNNEKTNETIIYTLNNVLKFSNENLVQKYSKNYFSKFEYLMKYLYAIRGLKEDKGNSSRKSKIIWQCWLQGENEMPELIKVCTDSVKKYNADSQYLLITQANLEDYVLIPGYITKKYFSGIIPIAQYSDIIRLLLLEKYGGVWIDSTVYETDKLPDEVFESDFFTLRNHLGLCFDVIKTSKDLELMCNYFNRPIMLPSSWFISSSKDNIIISGWLKLLLEYWKYENELNDYFIMDYFFVLLLLNNDICRKMFDNMPIYLTTASEVLQSAMPEEYNEDIYERIKTFSPIHKLTRKYTPNDKIKNRFYNKIIQEKIF